MKSAQAAPLSELGTHPEGREIARRINEPSFFEKNIVPIVAVLGSAAAVGGIASIPEPEMREYRAANPEKACQTVPDGVSNIEEYMDACRQLVAACAAQADVFRDLHVDMAHGTEGPNADRVIGLQDEAKRLKGTMDDMINSMNRASEGGRKPEKTVCRNEGPHSENPVVERTSRRFPRAR